MKNELGWSDLSPILLVLSAEPPSKPTDKPELVDVSLSSIVLKFAKDGEENGDLITDYVLF